jgi:aminoglycoside 2''-phosphotransferase
LRHGDLGGDNIRYDPATNRVTGIIDFTFAALGDPAVDLAGLSWYGEVFVEALSACYPTLADPALRSRARFYRSTFALQQALWAIRAGDAAEFEDGIAAYR